jgi:hypothetical protein
MVKIDPGPFKSLQTANSRTPIVGLRHMALARHPGRSVDLATGHPFNKGGNRLPPQGVQWMLFFVFLLFCAQMSE